MANCLHIRCEPYNTCQLRDQGPWHCAERGCPGGHMLPNASCAAAIARTHAYPEEGNHG